ncbi:MAG TPA: ABC transporter permease [Vicinamibacterales bacterium]|jgi:putative ABC transport system permease protein|nr:ABC transporter permease [Vicinamibacterales bacterium]
MTDLRDAVRSLFATPVVTAVAVLSLALGIGANTAIFSIVNALMLRSLPVKDPQQLVQILTGPQRTSWSNPLWEQLRERAPRMFNGAFAYSHQRLDLASGGEQRPAEAIMASGTFFDVLGVPAILGRTFTAANDVRRGTGIDARQVAVISYRFWQQHYGGSADAVGKAISLDRVPFTIIGVTGPDFTGVDQGNSFDVAIPLAAEPLIRGAKESAMDERSWWWLRVMARLEPGDSIERATAAVRAIQPQLREATLPTNFRPQDLPNYLKDPFTIRGAANGPNSLGRLYRDPLNILMGVVALVLLIACANIANLLLARASARRHELSVRVALGASSWRIVRQLLTESVVLAAAGAVLGLAFAQWAARLLVSELSYYGSRITLDTGLDWRVMAFTAGVAFSTALLFGIVPALRSTRVQPQEAMKEQGRSIVGESRFGMASLLVIAQVALSLVLVVGAALFVRTFSSLAHVRLGFDPNPVLIVAANAQRSARAVEDRAALYERMREAVLAVPGVQQASLQNVTPLSDSEWDTLIANPPGLSLSEKDRDVHVNAVSPGWFATYGTPIIAGRDFTLRDDRTTPHVVLVNETFAKKYFAGANPVGQTVRNEPSPGEDTPPLQIIGLVRDAVYDSLRDPVPPTMYQAQLQQARPNPSVEIAVRAASGSPALLTRSIVEAIGSVDRDVSLTFNPLRETVRDFTVQERMLAILSGFFGALALLLAGLGLYGVMSYAVSRRRTEIGIRMALGAGPGGAVRLVLTRAALLVTAGVAVGAAISLWASKFVADLLFGLAPRDASSLLIATMTLATIGALAAWLPARRAARIDPAQVLRDA